MTAVSDSRKQFLLANVATHFSTSADKLSDLQTSTAMDEFLDDGKVGLLVATMSGGKISLSNKLSDQQKVKNSLAFMKLRPDPITPDNLHSDILVTSLTDSPLSCLYHCLQKLYAPVLLENEIGQAKLSVQLTGFQLEGCTFDGSQLSENNRDSPSVSAVPAVTVAWIPKPNPDVYSHDQCISLPVYYDQHRDRVVSRLDLPCQANTQSQWIQCGAALFLKPQ